MINLENWIRRNGDGTPTTYWGYANPGSDISIPVWSIRRLVSDSGDQVYQYANNDFIFDKIWDQKEDYWVTPTDPTISGITIPNGISLTIQKQFGVSRFLISVYNNDRKDYHLSIKDKEISIKDIWNNDSTFYTYNITNVFQNTGQYTITVVAKNNAGKSNPVTITVQS